MCLLRFHQIFYHRVASGIQMGIPLESVDWLGTGYYLSTGGGGGGGQDLGLNKVKFSQSPL